MPNRAWDAARALGRPLPSPDCAWDLDPGSWDLEPGSLEPGSLEPWSLGAWSPGAWEPGSLGAWEPGALEPGSLGAWEPGSLGAWEPGSLRACGHAAGDTRHETPFFFCSLWVCSRFVPIWSDPTPRGAPGGFA